MPLDTAAPVILVVGPSWVGDMVMAQSLFKWLKTRWPGCVIDVVAPAWSLPILGRMPEVRDAQVLDVKHGEAGIAKRYRLGRKLRSKYYSRAIVLPRSLKAALVPYFARIPRRTGYLGEMRYGLLNDIRPFDKKLLDQTVKRFSYLGPEQASDEWKIYSPELTIDALNGKRCMAELGLDPEPYTIALLPGAEYGPAKQWPVEHCAALVQKVQQAGGQVWLLGSQKDRTFAQEVVDRAGGVGANLCGKTKIGDVIDLIALADVAVANDSGLMHIAAAVGTPVVAIYGSSSPEFTPPLCENATINWLQLDCSPCFERQCKFGHYDCLNKISADTVFGQLEIRQD